jgi:linoleoyl-CoA desaturase
MELLGLTLWQGIGLFMVISAVQSVILIILLAGTHFVEETQHYEPEAERRLDHSWVEHQFLASCDCNAAERWAEFISGGANMHLAHHIFLSICHAHLEQVLPLLEGVANKAGLPLHRMTLGGMIRSHFRHLRTMGRE